jgi:hypothetical protein
MCSTVCTSISSLPKIVHRGVAFTASRVALIGDALGRSSLLNQMPWPAGAGLIVSSTLSPVNSPFPENAIALRNVRCIMGDGQAEVFSTRYACTDKSLVSILKIQSSRDYPKYPFFSKPRLLKLRRKRREVA